MEDWEKELVPVFPNATTATAAPEDWERELTPALQNAPATPPPAPKPTENISQLEAAGIGLRSGLTKGWDARFGAWLQEQAQKAANLAPKGSLDWAGVETRFEQDPEQVGEDALKGNWMEYDAAVEQHPKTVGLTELGGDIASDLGANLVTGGALANPLGNALLGGIEGAGRSRGGAVDMLAAAGTGAALGGLFGVGGKYLGKVVPGGASVANPLINTAGAGLGELLSGDEETDAQRTKRRTQAATGLGLTLPGALRKVASLPFAKRADKATGEVREGLMNEDHRAALDVEDARLRTEKAGDDIAYANQDKLATSLKSRLKSLDSELDAEGKKVIKAEEESNKALISAWMKEEAAKKVKAAMDAGQEPDPQDLRDLGPEGDLHARALGILGNKVQEAFRYLRSQQGLEPHGFALTPKAQEGVKATVPDYAAKGNAQLEELAQGKGAMLEQIKAQLAADAPGPKRAATEGEGGVPEFDDVVQAQPPRDLYDAMPDVDPKTKVPDDVKAALRAKFGVDNKDLVDVPLEHLPVKPASGINPPAGDSFDMRMAGELAAGRERVGRDFTEGATRALFNPGGLVRGGALALPGLVTGNYPLAALGAAASIPVSGAANARGNATRVNRVTGKYRDPAAAASLHGMVRDRINGNEALRSRLGNFLNVQSADVLAQRIQWLMDNDPEVAALVAHTTPAP